MQKPGGCKLPLYGNRSQPGPVTGGKYKEEVTKGSVLEGHPPNRMNPFWTKSESLFLRGREDVILCLSCTDVPSYFSPSTGVLQEEQGFAF